MIRKLRRQFVVINMSLVAAVLVIVFAAMGLSTLRQTNRIVDETLIDALSRRMDEPLPGPEIGKHRPDLAALPAQRGNTLPFFCVQLDEAGEITDSLFQNCTVSSEVMRSAVEQAVASGNSTGTLRDYALRFSIRYSSAGPKIAFVDTSSVRTDMLRQLLMLLIAGIAGLAAFFFISLYLSNWALRPVERSWARQRQFVADASHELKTPLTVVLANTDILLSRAEQTIDSQLRWLESTKTESLRMKTLVDDMLFLARADADVPTKMEPFSLSDAVWSAALPFEALAFEANVRLNMEIESDLTLCGNEQQICQLTAILLDNAVKYAGSGGTVTARLGCKNDLVWLAVTNTGEPIDADKLPRLFERFYRTDAARDRNAGGYGLGLSIAQSIARLHHANILVTSSRLGGTTFTVEWREGCHAKQS